MRIGKKKHVLFNETSMSHVTRRNRRLQAYLAYILMLILALAISGCSKSNKNSVDTNDMTQEEQSGENQSQENQNSSQVGDNPSSDITSEDTTVGDTGSEVGQTNNEVIDTPSGDGQQSDMNTTDSFFFTEEGKKLYEVAHGFTEAYLNREDDIAKGYMAKEAGYDGLEDSYKSIDFIDLNLYEYDEVTKEALLSYAFVADGEDSYTYLSIELVYEDGAYKVDMYGLEK